MSAPGLINGFRIFLVMAFLFAGWARADAPEPATEETTSVTNAPAMSLGAVRTTTPIDLPASPANHWWMARYVGSLIVVGALLIGGFMILRRVQAFILPGSRSGEAPAMRLVGRLPLDQRNTLVVVHVRGEELVLATSPAGTRLLTKHDQPGPDTEEAP